MNKTDLIDKIAQVSSISKTAASRALDAFTTTVTKALAKGEDVVLVGFGTFTTSKRKARTGRNPQTGAVINIPARVIAKFRAGKKLKDAVK
jgi:DNA-binding protein HU-beta